MTFWSVPRDQAIGSKRDLLNRVLLNRTRNGARPEKPDYQPYKNSGGFKKLTRLNKLNRFVSLEMKRVTGFGYKIRTTSRKAVKLL